MKKTIIFLIMFLIVLISVSANNYYYDFAETDLSSGYTCKGGSGVCVSIAQTSAQSFSGTYSYASTMGGAAGYKDLYVTNQTSIKGATVIGEAIEVNVGYYNANDCGSIGLTTQDANDNMVGIRWTSDCSGHNGGAINIQNYTGWASINAYAGNASCAGQTTGQWYNITIGLNQISNGNYQYYFISKDASGTEVCSLYSSTVTFTILNNTGWSWGFGDGSGTESLKYFDDITMIEFFAPVVPTIDNNSYNHSTAINSANETAWADNDITMPSITIDTTPTIKGTTDVASVCRLGAENKNWSSMNSSQDCETTGGTNFVCSLNSDEALNIESGFNSLYISCANADNNNFETVLSSSGALNISLDLYTISGTVKNGTGSDFNNAEVIAFNQNDLSMLYNTTSNITGDWNINARSGTYTVISYFNNSLIPDCDSFIDVS